MSNLEHPTHNLELESIGSGTKYAAISFLIQINLMVPAFLLNSIVFNNTFAVICSWLIIFGLNIYVIYQLILSKTILKDANTSHKTDLQAIIYDYQAYLNLKNRLKALVSRSFLAFGVIWASVILGPLAPIVMVVALTCMCSLIILTYLHLPQLICLYFLIHLRLDINLYEIEYALEAEWQKQQPEQIDQEKTIISVSRTSINTQIPSASEQKSIQPLLKQKEDIALLTTPLKSLSEIESFLMILREHLVHICITQRRSIHSLIEVLQYLETRRLTLPITKRKSLIDTVQGFTEQLNDDFEVYFSHSEDQRNKYQPEKKIIPNVWLRTRIRHYTQQLIEQTNFVYERDLKSFTDHQMFIDHKITRVKDFKIVLEPSKVKKAPFYK